MWCERRNSWEVKGAGFRSFFQTYLGLKFLLPAKPAFKNRFGDKALFVGKDDYPTESEMKLSDAFMELDDKLRNQLKNANYPLEIFVKVININVDKENPILKRCEALKQYSEFIEQVRFNIENNIHEPFTNAIKQSIKNGFLSDYLNRKSTEVQNMLLAEYDYDTDIAVQRRESFEDGLSQGAHQAKLETAKSMKLENMSTSMIAHFTGLSPEEIEKL